MAEEKHGYKAQLAERADAFIAGKGPITRGALVEWVYEIALESYRNGLAEGKRNGTPRRRGAEKEDGNEDEGEALVRFER